MLGSNCTQALSSGLLPASLAWEGMGSDLPTPQGSLINCEPQIRLYYFQPQKYLPKNQRPRPTGQKENCHGTEGRRGPGHSPGTDHDGVLHHDVLSAGHHSPALIHAEVTRRGAGTVSFVSAFSLHPFFPKKNFEQCLAHNIFQLHCLVIMIKYLYLYTAYYMPGTFHISLV